MNRFADEALIEVSSGNGGNGCVAFRREKYVPLGGPSGGDGGKGGDVIFVVQRNLRTLVHLRQRQHFKAANGRDGEGRNRNGAKGQDVYIPLPPGSVIKDAESGELIKDFKDDTPHFTYLVGGNGGWGNTHFKSSIKQAPRHALPGKRGEARRLKIELQVMADIGFVGFPNAGKSSLLDRFTNARPKIAPYPFTTKIPNLGVLTLGDRDIVLADIPGILEGASGGLGLGLRFLKHIARTSGLAYLIDLSEENYLEAFDILKNELASFSPELLEKDYVLIGTKLDLEGCPERLKELEEKLPEEKIFGISVFTDEGLSAVSQAFAQMVVQGESASSDGGTGDLTGV
jgi:GTP-binding protein